MGCVQAQKSQRTKLNSKRQFDGIDYINDVEKVISNKSLQLDYKMAFKKSLINQMIKVGQQKHYDQKTIMQRNPPQIDLKESTSDNLTLPKSQIARPAANNQKTQPLQQQRFRKRSKSY